MAVRTGLAAFMFLAAAAAPAFAEPQAECVATIHAVQPIERTPRLGVTIVQDGQPVALSVIPDPHVGSITMVRLKRSEFEIRIPNATWAPSHQDAGLAVSASEELCVERLVRFGQSEEETPLFGRFRAMADYPDTTRLISARGGDGADYGYNFIDGERFDASGDGYRGFGVTSIDKRYGEDDLMQGQAAVTLVLYLNRGAGNPPTVRDRYGMNDVIDVTEVDVINVTFED